MSITTSTPDFIDLLPADIKSKVINYLSKLESEIAKEISKLQTENAKLMVSNISKSEKIKALTKEIENRSKPTHSAAVFFLPYNGHGDLPKFVKTADGKKIPIYYNKNDIDE